MANSDDHAPSGGPEGGLGGKTGFAIGLAVLIGLAAAGVYFWATLPPGPYSPNNPPAASAAPQTP